MHQKQIAENEDIVLSIKPKFLDLIESKQKDHEFRSRVPLNHIKKIWIYSCRPQGVLKYVADVGELIVFPQKIKSAGIGNIEFNSGLKKSKYAFPILHLYKLKSPITLSKLKKLKFHPPQSYCYLDNYPIIKKELLNSEKILVY